MGIVKIKKELKSTVNSSNSYNKQRDVLPNVSLNSLNNSNDEYKFDFGNNSAGMNNGVLKTEIGIMSACIKTAVRTIIKIIIFLGIIYAIIKFGKLNIDLTCFGGEEYLSKDIYWDEFTKVSLILGISLLIVSFMSKLFINGSIKNTLKKNYLSKTNIYIYDGFISIYNVVIYVLVAVLYFININNIFDKMEKLKEMGKIVEGVNIEQFNLLKYGVVVIIAVFIALNALRGVSIVYKKNKFVFEEQL